MPLQDFNGKWKEIESKNDSDFMKQMGMGKTKRRIAKRIKLYIEISVKNEKEYVYIHKLFGRKDEVTLGVEQIRASEMGKGKATVNLEGNALVANYEVIETNDKRFGIKLPPGSKMVNRLEVNAAKDRLTMRTTFNGVTIEKILKKKGSNEAEDLEDADAVKELEAAQNDDE